MHIYDDEDKILIVQIITSGQSTLTKKPHRRRTWFRTLSS